MRAINDVVDRALTLRHRQIQGWATAATPATRIKYVLVISNEPANLRELRVNLPFATLQRRRLIGGYTVWSNGRIAYSTRRETKNLTFAAIWVQRSVSAELALLLDSLALPYVDDLDGNLLVSPA